MILNTISAHKKLFVRAAQIYARNICTSNALRKQNLYESLGLKRDATQADIKNAYFELSKLYHPDRIAATDENLAKFREICAAYEILGNEQSRKLYDRGLLGEFKRPGFEETEDIVDPIVQFYRKRQDLSKPPSKAGEDLDAWTQTYFMEAKKKRSMRHELFQGSKPIPQEFENPLKYWLEFIVLLSSCYMFFSNFEGCGPKDVYRKIKDNIELLDWY